MKRLFVLMFLFIQTICFSQDWLKPYEYFVEAGWVIPNGFHVGWGVWHTYFGFNVFSAADTIVSLPTSVTDGTLAGTKTVNRDFVANATIFQIPLGAQYMFGSNPHKMRFGARAAWLPTIVYTTSFNEHWNSGDYINFLGDQYWWDGHEWRKRQMFNEGIFFRPASFEFSGTLSMPNCLYLSLSFNPDFIVFQDSRATVSVGYSFTRYLAKGK